jgi:hypothetical protein
MRFGSLGIGLSLLALGLLVPAYQQPANPKPQNWISYSKDVAPVFKAACNSCHAGKEAAAGLDFTDTARMMKAGVIKPGDAEHSVLIRRMKGLDGLPLMPKGFKAVDAPKIKIIEDWINAGAKLDQGSGKHWAYVAPVKAAVPKSVVKWGRNDLDAFVLEKMLGHKLKPSPEASKEILARRLYLDLTGLPPTVAELDAYLSDASPNAYEKLVDQLLASPHYGERQARMWLDLARYADTNGYEADRIRTAYLYRDWVINAFNKNMPYDQFTIEQLAGDMLPGATDSQKVATGFHRNSMFNEEGGVDPAESFYNTVIDRVTTTSATWLGTTMQCSRCHDHKFDPFTQRDFYKLYAVFSNVSYRKEGDYSKSFSEHWIEPAIKVATPESVKAVDEAKAKLKALEERKQAFAAENARDFAKWKIEAGLTVHFVEPKIESFKSTGGATYAVSPTNVIEVGGNNAEKDEYEISFGLPKANINGIRIEVLPEAGKPGGRASSQNFVMTDIGISVDGKNVGLAAAQADFVQEGYDLRKLLNGDHSSGWAIYPQASSGHRLVTQFRAPVSGSKGVLKLGFNSVWANHNLGRFRISVTESDFPLLDIVKERAQKLATQPVFNEKDDAILHDMYLATSPKGLEFGVDLEIAKANVAKMESYFPTALVMEDKPTAGKLTAAVHHRGEFLSPGELVEAGTPEVLPSPDSGKNMNRLELAKWLVNGKNPLTARVAVNRIWEQYFGRGIVETMDDFGTQGSAPINQKLLDWLSVKFVESKWDIKAMHKLLVTSATYRQSSNATPEALTIDPTNVYLARGPRFRMEAEMIRDTALQASSLLNPRIGGPSVMPFQPNGIWDSPYNGEQWMETKDKERFRRGIYVFAKRTAMYPSFMSFDASSRETCTVRRIRTNSPLQALALLNDQAYLEAARALGAKMLERGSLEQGLVYGFRAATSRKPSRDELTVLAKAYGNFRQKYFKHPDEAKKLGKDEREAAWTMIGNVLLNLDETITKG